MQISIHIYQAFHVVQQREFLVVEQIFRFTTRETKRDY